MSLVTLKGIGKIYVSDGNVAVGIRGVNLSFDRGEFVAITGKSGSGKSTLLNIISGMDSYEEGELYIEGEPTSHYLQDGWEEYRKKYVSFIFQDYNIIESFTVLQNVELALMHIENHKERRERAVELICRVGLESHLKHRGSQLSGGQKQRTVIARALAKDSPILLADEPTGNLDSQTSKEIISLLREISKDKLVIVVTHNFDEVAAYATRHIRVFDGAIESDHVISEPSTVCEKIQIQSDNAETLKKKIGNYLKNGITLGRIRYKAMPKLSLFMCFLMIISSLAVTFISALSGSARALFEENYMFEHIDGRVVIIREDGATISDKELDELANKVGASSYLHYDFMLDNNLSDYICSYDLSCGVDVGRLPVADNEVLLYLPIGMQPQYGKNELESVELRGLFGGLTYVVTGVKYFYDNTKDSKVIFTQSGYELATAMAYFNSTSYNFSAVVEVVNSDINIKENISITNGMIVPLFEMPDNSYYIYGEDYNNLKKIIEDTYGADFAYETITTVSGVFENYIFNNSIYDDYIMTKPNYDEYGYGSKDSVSVVLDSKNQISTISEGISLMIQMSSGGLNTLVVSPYVIRDFIESEYYAKSYTQASLFFKNDSKASNNVTKLRELGYIAVPSDTVREPEVIDMIVRVISGGFAAFVWLMMVIFIAMFVTLCSGKAMLATSGDIAVMRSMGIPVPVIKVSVYIQTVISLIPAVIATAAILTVVYITPKTNDLFLFLHWQDYLLIAIGLILINVLISRKYVKKMFDKSVKKTLKGGTAND